MADQKLAIALFESTHATRPRRMGITWPELAKLLTRHKVRQGKDGPAWSPTLYKEDATRGNAGVASLYCLVLDFDDGTAPDALIADWTKRGLAFVAHSTYSHAPDSPRWRAVFPLEKPVGPLRWKDIYQALATDLGRGNADPACKDPARMYYLPAHPPGIAPFTYSQVNGLPLECSFVASSPSGLSSQARAKGENHLHSRSLEPSGGNANAMSSTSAPELVSPFAARNERLAGGGRKPEGRFKGEVRPGADYDARATQRDVLELLGKHGWRECGRRDGVVALTRPAISP